MRTRVAVTVAVVVATVAAAVAPAVAEKDPASRWVGRGTFTAPPSQLDGVACLTATTCVAVGATTAADAYVARSTDGGVRWSTVAVPAGDGALWSVSCGSPTTCVAAGDGDQLLRTTDAGRTWTGAWSGIAADVGALASVRCFSATTCVATGEGIGGEGVVITTTDGGTDWRSISPFGFNANVELFGEDCPSALECVVVGLREVADGVAAITSTTTNGGLTWTLGTEPSGVQIVRSVACTSATVCLATATTEEGSSILETSDAGASWTATPLPSADAVGAIACVTTSTCDAVGQSSADGRETGLVLTTSDGGTTWSRLTAPPGSGSVVALSCGTTPDCVLAGQTEARAPQLSTLRGGAAVPAAPLPGGVVTVSDVACATPTTCVGGGTQLGPRGFTGVLLVSRGATGRWSAEVPRASATVDAVSCPDPTTCLALVAREPAGSSVETGTLVESSSNGGATWRPLASGRFFVSALDCFASHACVAVGAASLSLHPGSSRWRRGTLPKGVGLGSVACVAVRCVATGYDDAGHGVVATSGDDGSRWSVVRTVGPRESLGNVSCLPDARCLIPLAIGGNLFEGGTGGLLLSSDAGARWRSVPLPAATPSLDDVACLNPNDCVAIGDDPDVVLEGTDGAKRWRATSPPVGALLLESVACGASGCWVTEATTSGATAFEALR